MQLSVTGLRTCSAIVPIISLRFRHCTVVCCRSVFAELDSQVIAGAYAGASGGPPGAPAGSEMVKLNVYSLSGGQPFAPRRSSELLLEHCFGTMQALDILEMRLVYGGVAIFV